MIIGIPVYDDVDMFDVTGPFEMFDWAGFEVDLLAAEPGMKKFRSQGFPYSVTRGFAQARAYDAIWVPGGEPAALAGFVHDRNRLTGGGISSGLDEALKLIELLAGTDLARKVQQSAQYYPDPPVSSAIPPSPAQCPIPTR